MDGTDRSRTERDMDGTDGSLTGFGLFKLYVADQLTNPVIAKLTTYFNFPPALHARLQGEELEFVNTLIQRGIIKETDISVLLNALNQLKLRGIQEDVQREFLRCMAVAPQDNCYTLSVANISCKESRLEDCLEESDHIA
ncbi:uncharacterized protein [Apostichopus japonicus]|uniref:uncharacterized protein isoform X2 n=1 Tax=Stichopus japonicus TaxID=307972 RepID=UPI003AB2ED2B